MTKVTLNLPEPMLARPNFSRIGEKWIEEDPNKTDIPPRHSKL